MCGCAFKTLPNVCATATTPGRALRVTGGFAQQLVDGLIRKAHEISEQIASVHEIRSEHFWNRESPQAMSDVFQKLILEQVAAKAAARFASHDAQMPLCLQLRVSNFSALQRITSESCETRFGDPTI